LLIITKIARGGARYIQYLSMYSHVVLITALGALITTPIMVYTGTMLDVSSLAAVFIPNGDFSMMSYNVLTAITLFEILKCIILVIGVREINGFSLTKSIVVVVIMFVLSVSVTAALSGSSVFIMDLSFKAMGYSYQ